MPQLPVYLTEVDCPVVDQAAPTLEEITAGVGRLGGVLYRVGERGLDHRCELGLFRTSHTIIASGLQAHSPGH